MAPRLSGFTLMEMLLVIAILTIVLAIGTPVYMSLSNTNQLDVATNILAQDLYQAQVNSRAQAEDSQWGVAVQDQAITLFKGSSYAARDSGRDVVYQLPSSIHLSGTNQVVYSQLYGLPTAGGSFGLTDANGSRTVTVNNKGMVQY